MLSKNNSKERSLRNQPHKQRFTIRKLTIGVASVLIGFTFMGISTVKADTTTVTESNEMILQKNSAGTVGNEQKTANVNNNKIKSDDLVANSKVSSNNNVISAATTASGSAPITTSSSDQSSATNLNSNITPAHFTGTITMTSADGTKHAFGNQDGMTKTATITYRLSSWGGDWKEVNVSFKGNSQYIIYIPQGFTTDNLTLMQGGKTLSGNYVQSLGKVGPNEEQTFIVTLPWIPAYVSSTWITAVANLTVENSATPSQYTASTDTLLRPVANGAFVTGNQIDTVELNGTKYQVLHSVTDGGSTQPNTTVSYTIGSYQEKVNFTGQVTFDDGNSNNFGTTSKDTKSAKITYTIQNNISGQPVDYYYGPGDYLVFIPQGFKANSLEIDPNYKYKNDVTIIDRGTVGPNGEQVYEVKTEIKPNWSLPLTLTTTIQAQSGYEGKDFTVWGANLLKAIYDKDNYQSSTSEKVKVGGTEYPVFGATHNAVIYHYGFHAVQPQTFTGTTQWSDGNNQVLTDASTTKISYKVQGYGVSDQQASLGQGRYLVYIPQGFTTTVLKVDTSQFYGKSNANNVKIESLGTINGQQAYLVTVTEKPVWANPLYLTADLTANADAGGSYTSSSSKLLYAVDDNANFVGNPLTITINGTTYSVIKTVATTSQSDPTNRPQNYTYMFPNVGTTPINSGDYTITKVSGQGITTNDSSKNSGYELLNVNGMVFKRNSIKAGSYLNIQWGLPTANGLIPYDKTLSSSVPVMFHGNQIGTIYSMGTTYRLVFNSKAAELNQDRDLSVDFNIKWNNAGSHTPSANNGNLVYRYTNDQSQNGKQFTFTPANDIQISGTGINSYSSGLQVKGTYIYPGYHYGEQAYIPITASAQVSKRYWETNTVPSAAPNWGSAFYITPSINALGKDFTVTIDVPVFAIDSGITVKPHTENNQDAETTIANNIKKAEAPKMDLSNTVIGTNDTYHIATAVPNDVGVKVTIDHENYTNANGKERTKYTFHIVMDHEAALNGSFIDLLDVSSQSPFTVPDGIKTYKEDSAAANQITKGSYSGVNTGNKKLLTILENAGRSSVAITSDKLATPIKSENLLWGGFTGITNNTDLDISGNSGNASQRSDADMYNPQGTAMWIFSDDDQILQKNLEGNADFRHVSLRFRDGFARSGQGIDNMYTIIKELRKQDPNAILRVHWDLTGLFLGKKTANVTITYPDGSTDVTTMQVLVLQEPYFINHYQTRPDDKGTTDYVDPTSVLGNLDKNDPKVLGRPVDIKWTDGQGPAITADTPLGIYPENSARASVTYNDDGLSLVSWPKDGAFIYTVPTVFITHNLQTDVSRGQKQSTMIVQDRVTNQIDSATTFDQDGHQLQTYLKQTDGTLKSADGRVYGQLATSKVVATTSNLQNLVNLSALNPADYTLSWSILPTRVGNHLHGLVAAQLAPAMFINIPVDVQLQAKPNVPIDEKPAETAHPSSVVGQPSKQPVFVDQDNSRSQSEEASSLKKSLTQNDQSNTIDATVPPVGYQAGIQQQSLAPAKASVIENHRYNPAITYSVSAHEKRLPQTGRKANTSLMWLGMSGMLILASLAEIRKRKLH